MGLLRVHGEEKFLRGGIFLWVVLAGTFYGIWEVGVWLGGWVELRVGGRWEYIYRCRESFPDLHI